VQIFDVDRGICVYAMVPDEMMKLPVTCVRFYPLPVDGDHAERSHIVAASCKRGNIIQGGPIEIKRHHFTFLPVTNECIIF